MFSGWFCPPGELLHPGQEAVGQRGEVVARVEDVGLAALAFLQPHEIRAGREERPGALTVQLQDDAAGAEHHPHRDHDVVDGLEGHVSEHCTEVVVEEAFEDVQRDVGEAGVNVGVDSQNYSVRTDNAARDDVSLSGPTHKEERNDEHDAAEGHPENHI